MGRGVNPPPQLGQTLWSLCSTHSAQKVHSYEQMRASSAAGGRSLSQYSQFGRRSSAMGLLPNEDMDGTGEPIKPGLLFRKTLSWKEIGAKTIVILRYRSSHLPETEMGRLSSLPKCSVIRRDQQLTKRWNGRSAKAPAVSRVSTKTAVATPARAATTMLPCKGLPAPALPIVAT